MPELFRGIDEEGRKRIMHDLDGVQYALARGEDLMDRISPGLFLGVVDRGWINITRTDSGGGRVLLFSAAPGEIFGPYYTRVRRDGTRIVAEKRSRVTLLDYSLFLSSRKTDEVYAVFNKNLVEMTVALDGRISDRARVLMQRSIRGKLLEFFRQETGRRGTRSFVMPFTFTFLAEWLSVDRSAMQRELKNLRDDGFVLIKGKRVTLLDAPDSSVYNRY